MKSSWTDPTWNKQTPRRTANLVIKSKQKGFCTGANINRYTKAKLVCQHMQYCTHPLHEYPRSHKCIYPCTKILEATQQTCVDFDCTAALTNKVHEAFLPRGSQNDSIVVCPLSARSSLHLSRFPFILHCALWIVWIPYRINMKCGNKAASYVGDLHHSPLSCWL